MASDGTRHGGPEVRARPPTSAMTTASAWCAWCGRRITVGLVTSGGVVFHLVCWRRRRAVLRWDMR